ncbi:helix-turn-helix domain-containing protein [uncultured Pseudoalteromonas sp.]|uniref:helix-turn-helix domain-containing protein n=1 Tax=uncultured Pseudoalteromonas sp. TaxID=114053 RepID=UPI002596EEB1|nr:helix-turn-helix domain-containing protein [uncultured Pseudoalteromonas sp.]
MLPNNFGHSVVNQQQHPLHNHISQPHSAKDVNTNVKVQPEPNNNIIQLWIVEKNAIEDAINQCDGNIPLAAAYLGISASTIYRKMKSWVEN